MSRALGEKWIQYNFQPDFLARQKDKITNDLYPYTDTCTSHASFINLQPPKQLTKSSKSDWCYSPYTCRSE